MNSHDFIINQILSIWSRKNDALRTVQPTFKGHFCILCLHEDDYSKNNYYICNL